MMTPLVMIFKVVDHAVAASLFPLLPFSLVQATLSASAETQRFARSWATGTVGPGDSPSDTTG